MDLQKLDTKDIGKRIRQLRKTRGLDQLQLANVLNLSRSQVSNLENGRRNLNIHQIKMLADFFGVSISTLGVKTNEVETVELLERAKLIFEDSNIPASEKQELYEQIMRMYITAKDSNQ